MIARSLNGEVNLPQALNATLGQVAELLHLQTGWIWLLDEETGDHYLAASQNLPPVLAENPEKMQGGCYCLSTFRDGDLNGAANVNFISCSRLQEGVSGTDGLRYHASIPLYAHGKKLGVMNVASGNWREFSNEDLQLLYTIGDLLSIAIERGRLFEKSMELAVLEERNRLAREIHDTLAQGLSAIILKLETTDLLLENKAAAAKIRESIHTAMQQTRESLEEARRSVLNLRAVPLEGRGLKDGIADLIAARRENSAIDYTFSTKGDFSGIAARIENGIFRIVQEALSNIERHSQADSASIILKKDPEQISLAISDNGKGFNTANISPKRFGLIGINERVTLLGGKLTVKSSRGSGTEIKVSIPLNAKK